MAPLPCTRRVAASMLASLVVMSTVLSQPAAVQAVDPPATAAEHLARQHGGAPSDYRLRYERSATVPETGETLWTGKLEDAAGELHVVYEDRSGVAGGPEMLGDRRRGAIANAVALEAKGDDALRARVANVGPSASVPVAVWLNVDTTPAVESVRAAHPEIEWVSGRPSTDTLEAARGIRAELHEARRLLYVAAAEQLAAAIAPLGGAVGYASDATPLAFVDLPASAAEQLAALPSVATIGLERTWTATMSTAGPTVDGNWTSGSGDSGAGIRVAVVEYGNVRNSGDLAGRVVASHSTSGSLSYSSSSQFDHPTWVAGAIAGGGAYPGVAPSARIVSASTGGGSAGLVRDRAVIATTDWAISPSGGDADVVNLSLIQDTSTGSEEARRYFDSVVDEDLRIVVAASGNFSALGTWRVGSPGTGWNVLTVGGTDDRNTSARTDDRIWYVPGSNGSSYLDPPGTAWNANGDFNKPNLSAPAVGVRTSNGLAASGTSVATPIVSGLAAQLVSRAPILMSWPETVRSLLIAGAVHRTRMPDGSYNADHEGSGSASGLWANRILNAGDGSYGGYRHGGMSGTFSQPISVYGGQRLRVALTWNSRTSGSSNLAKTDALASDLDLRVRLPNGTVYGSYSFDNSYETIDIVSPTAGTAILEVIGTRVAAGGERYSLAWAKIGGDRTPPAVTHRAPEAGEPWAAARTDVTITFSEPVTGIVASNVFITPAAGGAAIPARLTYHASARRVVLAPTSPVPPGSYRVTVTSGVRDHVGNALSVNTWTFSVVAPASAWQTTLAGSTRIDLASGSHTGFQFDANGDVSATRSVTLSSASGANVDRRALIVGQPGRWLRVMNGIWAGYWIRESKRAHMNGNVEQASLATSTRMTFSAGAHTGYRFGSGGVISDRKTATLSAASGAETNARAVINGAWHLAVTNGIWAGYWVPETPRSYLPGARDHRDLGGNAVRFAAGRHGGYRFDAAGAVIGTRSAALTSPSSAPGISWAIVNGGPRILIGAGIWSGYWVGESAVVAIP